MQQHPTGPDTTALSADRFAATDTTGAATDAARSASPHPTESAGSTTLIANTTPTAASDATEPAISSRNPDPDDYQRG